MPKKFNFSHHLRMKSSTFYLSSLWLSPHVRPDVVKLYYFCRYLDDLADKPNHQHQGHIATILTDISNGSNHHPISQHMHAIIETHQIPSTVAVSLIKGIQKDLTNIKIKSQQALIQYAYEVAGTVGIMMAHILDTKSTEAQHHAIDLSIAMQLTNIARDVYEDASIGRRYLPGQWLYHASPEIIIQRQPTTQIHVNQAIYKIIQLAEAYYASGIAGIHYLPNQYQNAILKAALLYQKIGHNLMRMSNPFQRTKTRLTLLKKLPILLKNTHLNPTLPEHPIHLHNDICHLPFTHHVGN